MKTKTINTNCHGCKLPMEIPATPARITDMDGKEVTFYPKPESAWICVACRLEPSKLRAARVAAGMPERPENEGCEADL